VNTISRQGREVNKPEPKAKADFSTAYPNPNIIYLPYHSTQLIIHVKKILVTLSPFPILHFLSLPTANIQNLTQTFKMPSSTQTHTPSHCDSPRYYLITNISQNTLLASPTEHEIDLHAESWKLPYSIDDSDLMFDGKPLNMLYEENKWMAEHVTYFGEETARRSRKDDVSISVEG